MKHLPGGPQTDLLNKKADYLTYQGVLELVSKIKAYWAKRDKYPSVWAEAIPQTVTGDDIYQVRSDMVGGRPQ